MAQRIRRIVLPASLSALSRRSNARPLAPCHARYRPPRRVVAASVRWWCIRVFHTLRYYACRSGMLQRQKGGSTGSSRCAAGCGTGKFVAAAVAGQEGRHAPEKCIDRR